MAKTQSRSARGSCDSEERRSSSAKPRSRGPLAERDTKTKGKKGARAPSPSLSHTNSTKPKSKKPVQTPTEPNEDEASDPEPEPEPEETEETEGAEETEEAEDLEESEEPEEPEELEEAEEPEEPESSSSDCEESELGTPDDEILCDPDFDFVGADLHLKAVDQSFRVHIHMFKDFNGLESEIDEAPMEEDGGCKTLTLDTSAEDIRGVLTVLYTKPYEPHDFNPKVFESCLILATEYENPGLRNYAIQYLERHSLEPVDQFRLGRDCGLPEWRSKAIVALSKRDEPLTEAEAEVLGPATFATIAIAREKAQYAKGHREGMGQAPTAAGLGAQSAAQRL